MNLVFTAYTLANLTTREELCSSQTLTETMATPYVVPDIGTEIHSMMSVFLDHLGMPCRGFGFDVASGLNETTTTVYPAANTAGTARILPTPAPVAGTPALNPTSTSSTQTGTSNTTDNGPLSPPRTRIALGVSIPIGSILILLSLVFGIRRYRSKRHHTTISSSGRTAEQDPPYLQQKGELDAIGNTVFEMDGRDRRHELEPDAEIHEMPTRRCGYDGRTELRGEEHASELRAI